MLLSLVAVVGVLDESEESFLGLRHGSLRVSQTGGQVEVLSLYLGDGLLDQLDLVVLVRPYFKAFVPWMAHSGQIFVQQLKQ